MTLAKSFRSLNEDMLSRAFLLNNPLFLHVSQMGSTLELVQAIRQYVRLPEEIISYLQAAAAWFPTDHPIHKELERNWGQEAGSVTAGIPHVELLKTKLQTDLGIDARRVVSNEVTKKFLETTKEGMKHHPWFAVGQAYALEATAVPELTMLVGPALNLYAKLTNQVQPIQSAVLQPGGSGKILPLCKTKEDHMHSL